MLNNKVNLRDIASNIDGRYKPDTEHKDKLRAEIDREFMKSRGRKRPTRAIKIWGAVMKTRTFKVAVAAVVMLIVFGGITLWPSNTPQDSKWWTGPASALGKEILPSLDTVKSMGIKCRERTILVMKDGVRVSSGTWDVFYVSHNSYRRDIYDGNNLRETQWYVPDANAMVQTSVRFDLGSYSVSKHKGSFGQEDPIERMRFYAGLLDRADKVSGTKIIESHECVGFELRASKYGDNPEQWVDSIWFDIITKLPVCIEKRGRPVTGHPEETFTTVQDQFDYNLELSEDTFIPRIPENFIHEEFSTTNKK